VNEIREKKSFCGNDKVSNTFVSTVSFQASLCFLRAILQTINTQRANCSSLTSARCSDKLHGEKQSDELAEKENAINFKYDYGRLKILVATLLLIFIEDVSLSKKTGEDDFCSLNAHIDKLHLYLRF